MNSLLKLNYQRKKIDQERIAAHYDDVVLNQHLYTEEKDATTNLRRINNFIKTCILNKYVKKNDVVLDLGCGKGGDLHKYQKLKIKKYVGVDVSEKSIKEAKNRANKLKINFVTQFCLADAYNDRLLFRGCFSTLNQFDVITSQFSFHYAFFDDLSLKTAISNVDLNLKPGGFFIITVPRKNIIINRILKHRSHNSLYRITDVNPKSENSASWKSYSFSLVGSVDECIEYFVDYVKLKNILEEKSFDFVERTRFTPVLKEGVKKNPDLFTKMKIENPNKNETDVIDLYEVIVFQKRVFDL
jgi:mRNA (guanine-N7-)-methyltransferase